MANEFENALAAARDNAQSDKTAKVTAVYGDPVETEKDEKKDDK